MKKNYPFQTHLLVNNFEDLFTRRTFSLKINLVNNSTNSALNTEKDILFAVCIYLLQCRYQINKGWDALDTKTQQTQKIIVKTLLKHSIHHQLNISPFSCITILYLFCILFYLANPAHILFMLKIIPQIA